MSCQHCTPAAAPTCRADPRADLRLSAHSDSACTWCAFATQRRFFKARHGCSRALYEIYSVSTCLASSTWTKQPYAKSAWAKNSAKNGPGNDTPNVRLGRDAPNARHGSPDAPNALREDEGRRRKAMMMMCFLPGLQGHMMMMCFLPEHIEHKRCPPDWIVPV